MKSANHRPKSWAIGDEGDRGGERHWSPVTTLVCFPFSFNLLKYLIC